MLKRVFDFIRRDIWRIRLRDYSPRKSFLIRLLRIVLLAFRGFNEDKCKFRASALTFFSLMSIVPVMAVMFGIAKGFGLQDKVQALIVEKMAGQEEVANRIIEFANTTLAEVNKANGGLIAGVGVAFLFWAIIKLLGSIEGSFNEIWGVKKGRSIGRKFSDYLSIMLVCPILLVAAGSITVFVQTKIRLLVDETSILDFFDSALMLMIKVLPYCTIWIAFSFVFIFLPNTKVKWSSGIVGGIVAGTIFQFVQWAYVAFQIGAARYNAFYGSFAALPLFLAWLQISWFVVLFGAEVSFAHQNVETYEFEPDCLNVSYSFKKLLALVMTERLIRNFRRAERPVDAVQLAHELEMPIRLVRQILFELVQAQVLSEVVKNGGKDVAYQPAVDIDMITVKYVLDAMEHSGTDDIPVGKSPEMDKLNDCLCRFGQTIAEHPGNVRLQDLEGPGQQDKG